MKAIDVMGFAGSMACGVDQAGFDVIAKREPSAFKGFGVASMTYNMPWLDSQVSVPEDWRLMPGEDVDLVFGCPPCSGFSQLSSMNVVIYKDTGTTYRGEDAEINECMVWLIDYAARIGPPVVIMESVGAAYKLGRAWFEKLWLRLRERTGMDYKLTHVRMNAALVGGDVIRPRYFMVAHTVPFGVGLDFVEPRTFREVVEDLPAEEEPGDPDWGHVTAPGGPARLAKTVEWLQSMGRDWRPGTRLPLNTEGLEPPEFWLKAKGRPSKREGYRDDVYSHWYSTDAFSPLRWRPDKPFGVVVAATLDRAVHAFYPRNLTYREAARFMSIPDSWSLRVLVEGRKTAELGKAIPSASAKWIAHWAKTAIEGTPGEYAGNQDTDDDRIRVINVTTAKDVDAIFRDETFEPNWNAVFSDSDPKNWLIDRKARPTEWWQRDDELRIFVPRTGVKSKGKTAGPEPADRGSTPRPGATPPPSGTTRTAGPRSGVGPIVRISPEVMASLLSELGLSKEQAAAKLGVSASRVSELVGHQRPKSWLNAARWDEVQAALRA